MALLGCGGLLCSPRGIPPRGPLRPLWASKPRWVVVPAAAGQCLGVLLAEDGVVNFTEVDVHGLLIGVEVDGAVATFMA